MKKDILIYFGSNPGFTTTLGLFLLKHPKKENFFTSVRREALKEEKSEEIVMQFLKEHQIKAKKEDLALVGTIFFVLPNSTDDSKSDYVTEIFLVKNWLGLIPATSFKMCVEENFPYEKLETPEAAMWGKYFQNLKKGTKKPIKMKYISKVGIGEKVTFLK